MPNISLKNIPEALYDKLKESAQINHRSLNSEIIHCLEVKLDTQQVKLTERLAIARNLRDKTAQASIPEEEWDKAIAEDRP